MAAEDFTQDTAQVQIVDTAQNTDRLATQVVTKPGNPGYVRLQASLHGFTELRFPPKRGERHISHRNIILSTLDGLACRRCIGGAA
jgi:hypothetical protein